MITKETFLSAFEKIKLHRDLEMNLCSTLESLTDGCVCDALIYSRYEDLVVNLLEEIFETTLISYYLYELDFGERWTSDCSLDVDETNALKDPGSLYDYLIKNK